MAEFVIRQPNGAVTAAADGYVAPATNAPGAVTRRKPVRLEHVELIEQIATWVAGAGDDPQRMALADGIRERRFMPEISIGPHAAKFIMRGDRSMPAEAVDAALIFPPRQR